MMELAPFLRGFGVSFALIAAIGAQNAYLLTRSIHRNHHWLVALVASLLDLILIVLGLLGMGKLVEQFPALLKVTTLGGALFLLIYGGLAFRNMFKDAKLRISGGQVSAKKAVMTLLAISLLNPHVYLDTVVFIGSIGIQESIDHRFVFAMGAACASCVWFFSLALCGQMMQVWFQKPVAWKILDGFIALVMWAIAFSLINRFI